MYRTVVGNKSDARKEEIRLKAEAGALPRGVAGQDVTLEEYSAQWMSLYGPSVRPRSAQLYQRTLDKMILPLLGSIRLRDLDAIQIQRAFNLMPYAPSSKQRARVVLNTTLTKARKHIRLITEDLCEDLATTTCSLPSLQNNRT